MRLSKGIMEGCRGLFKSDTTKGKGKIQIKLSLCFFEHHAMKAYWENGGIAPRIL
jgi:hypothetical protein